MTARPFDLAAVVPPPPAPAAPAFDLGDLVAPKGFAPRKWQAPRPDEAWATRAMPVPPSSDLDRVLALPRRPPLEDGSDEAEAMIEYVTARYSLGPRHCRCAQVLSERGLPARPCVTRLRLAQAWGLYEIGTVGGLAGFVGTGFGKSILSLLAPLAFRDCRTAVLLMPSKLVNQMILDYQLLAEHFRVPQLVDHRSRWTNSIPGMPVLHIYPYSKLSREESSIFLEDMLKPDVVIGEEAHRLRYVDTATTSRVLRLAVARPDTRFAFWTGSFTDKQIEEFAHLLALSLKHRSPLPIKRTNVEDWSRAVAFDPDDRCPPGALLDLCESGENVVDGLHRRMVETEGVVFTTGASVDCELVITERVPPEIPNDPVLDSRSLGVSNETAAKLGISSPKGVWPGLADCITLVREAEQRPDGEELVGPLAVQRTLRELACGFFYRWIYPHNVFPDDQALVDLWFACRQAFNKELRTKLKRRAPRLDSEKLCIDAAKRFHGDLPPDPDKPDWESEFWPAWRDVKDLVHPETEAVRLSDYLARDAAAWAAENRGIVWYESAEFGLMIHEASGLPVYGGGDKAAAAILKERGDRSIIASISSHGEGLNGLQYSFADQHITQPPSSNARWEQALARVVRTGQKAGIARAAVYLHTPELRRSLDQARKKAAYVQGMLGSTQKLTLGFRAE